MGIILLILLLSAYPGAALVAISLFVGAMREKGHSDKSAGLLWYIGIFATPIVVGLYVASLPDKRGEAQVAPLQDELPAI